MRWFDVQNWLLQTLQGLEIKMMYCTIERRSDKAERGQQHSSVRLSALQPASHLWPRVGTRRRGYFPDSRSTSHNLPYDPINDCHPTTSARFCFSRPDFDTALGDGPCLLLPSNHHSPQKSPVLLGHPVTVATTTRKARCTGHC